MKVAAPASQSLRSPSGLLVASRTKAEVGSRLETDRLGLGGDDLATEVAVALPSSVFPLPLVAVIVPHSDT